jgi:hypothetical protein
VPYCEVWEAPFGNKSVNAGCKRPEQSDKNIAKLLVYLVPPAGIEYTYIQNISSYPA